MSEENFGDEKEEVFVRRLEKRLAANEASDRPYLRKFIGFLIIIAAFYFGWKSLDRDAAEIKRRRAENVAVNEDTPVTAPSATPQVKLSSVPSKVASNPDIAEAIEKAPLDSATIEVISDCTKGANAFRLLSLKPGKSAENPATLESVFKPVLEKSAGKNRVSLQLQNVRIRAKNGEEWRLHASPNAASGKLSLKLFRVASDGLPEVIAWPKDLEDLASAPLTDDAVSRFLQHAAKPGRALEIERHEAWSYADGSGLQIIWADEHIFDIQAFTRDRFLACNRGERAGRPRVTCKCLNR